MNDSDETLISQEQQSRVISALKEILNSQFKDPSNPPTAQEILNSYTKGRGEAEKYYKADAYDFSNPKTLYRVYWYEYLTNLVIQGQPSNKKGTKRYDTAQKRKKSVNQIAKYLGHSPSSSDLRAAFPTITELDDEIFHIIDNDLKRLFSSL